MKEVTSVIRKLLTDLNTKVSLDVLSRIDSGDYRSLVNLSIDPSNYESADSFKSDYVAISFLKKYVGLPTGIDTKAVAEDAFLVCEARCSETNARLLSYEEGTSLPPDGFNDFVYRCRQEILRILGPAPRIEDLEPRFGPGATSANRGSSITIMDKLSCLPELTRDAYWCNRMLNRYFPSWHEAIAEVHPKSVVGRVNVVDDFGNVVTSRRGFIAPKLVRGNRFTTVPKNAKTDRGICVEPHLNASFQMAVGKKIRDRLSRVGIHLDNAQEVHGSLARLGSLDGSLATIDLSAASDTISYEIVKLLFPEDWFYLLASLRSPETFFRGDWVALEKFSSQGNGFTFEMETLLFYAMSLTAMKTCQANPTLTNCRAYGDDLIIASHAAPTLVQFLNWSGFVTNADKTFISGPFRESCGQDYFLGHMVRPFFLKEELNEVHNWFSLANGIRRMGCSNDPDGVWDPRYLRAWLECISHIPSQFRRARGPSILGDAVIHDSQSKWLPLMRRFRNGPHRGLYYLEGLFRQPVIRPLERYGPAVQYTAALAGCSSDGQALRGQISGVRLKKIVITY